MVQETGEGSSLSGEQLARVIRGCREGDTHAYQRLFDAYHRRVFDIAYGLTSDYGKACDVMQEVFVKLLTRIHQFQFASSFDTWLYRIVLNAAHDEGRRTRRESATEAPVRTVEATQQDSLEQREIVASVREAISALSPKLRSPIVLRYMTELSYDEIASVLAISPGTVASRLARGHAALARQLNHLRRGSR